MEKFSEFWNLRLVSLATGTEITVGQIVIALLVVVMGFVLTRLVQRVLARQMKNSKFDANVAQTVQRLVFYSMMLLVLITALSMLNIPISALAFVSGAVAIGVGFGAQNIINNFISGWILMSEQPVRIGDFIEVDDHKGVVEFIGNRSTRIKRVDGVHLMVPNSQMLERVVINWTLVDLKIRSTVRIGVNYGSPVELVAKLFQQAVEEQTEVLKESPVLVVFEDFGDNALIFDAVFWCEVGGERELRVIRSQIRFRISHLFEEHGIGIAFPQRDLHLDTLKPLDIRLLAAEPVTASPHE